MKKAAVGAAALRALNRFSLSLQRNSRRLHRPWRNRLRWRHRLDCSRHRHASRRRGATRISWQSRRVAGQTRRRSRQSRRGARKARCRSRQTGRCPRSSGNGARRSRHVFKRRHGVGRNLWRHPRRGRRRTRQSGNRSRQRRDFARKRRPGRQSIAVQARAALNRERIAETQGVDAVGGGLKSVAEICRHVAAGEEIRASEIRGREWIGAAARRHWKQRRRFLELRREVPACHRAGADKQTKCQSRFHTTGSALVVPMRNERVNHASHEAARPFPPRDLHGGRLERRHFAKIKRRRERSRRLAKANPVTSAVARAARAAHLPVPAECRSAASSRL